MQIYPINFNLHSKTIIKLKLLICAKSSWNAICNTTKTSATNMQIRAIYIYISIIQTKPPDFVSELTLHATCKVI